MATMSIRLSDSDKKEADNLFKELGLTTNSAINMFIKQCIRTKSFPFIPSLDNNTLLTKALDESDKILQQMNDGARTGYDTCEELFEAIDNKK